jgi:hypothetical protein
MPQSRAGETLNSSMADPANEGSNRELAAEEQMNPGDI